MAFLTVPSPGVSQLFPLIPLRSPVRMRFMISPKSHPFAAFAIMTHVERTMKRNADPNMMARVSSSRSIEKSGVFCIERMIRIYCLSVFISFSPPVYAEAQKSQTYFRDMGHRLGYDF